jgi:integrase
VKAEKLPSGNWRIKVEVGRDKNGKRKFASVTAPSKREAMEKAATIYGDKLYLKKMQTTVAMAIEQYITDRESELSPSTVRAYRSLQKTRFGSINDTPVSKLQQSDLQRLLGASEVSSKTKRNVRGLLSAALAYAGCRMDFSSVRIKPDPKKKNPLPPTEEVSYFVCNTSGELQMMVAIAAACGLRRGEIFALRVRSFDSDKNKLKVESAMVKVNGGYVEKSPKTYDSVRNVDVPAGVSVMLQDFCKGRDPNELMFKGKMSALSTKFERYRKAFGYTWRFHDLRHYYASLLVLAKVPKIYAMRMGGWSTPETLERVYEDVFPNALEEEGTRAKNFIDDETKGLFWCWAQK